MSGWDTKARKLTNKRCWPTVVFVDYMSHWLHFLPEHQPSVSCSTRMFQWLCEWIKCNPIHVNIKKCMFLDFVLLQDNVNRGFTQFWTFELFKRNKDYVQATTQTKYYIFSAKSSLHFVVCVHVCVCLFLALPKGRAILKLCIVVYVCFYPSCV